MEVNDRQITAMTYLLSSKEYVTAGDLAAHLGVSVRTVYRDIAAINSVAAVIVNAPGKGVKLDYAAFTSEAERLMRGQGGRGLSVQARRRAILMLLLVSAPHPRSVVEFSEIFHVGTSSIQNDLAQVALLAEEKNLTLTSSSKGTTLVGTEVAIREALADAIIPLIVHESTPRADAGNELAFLRSQGIFREEDLDKVADVIAATEEKHALYLENPYYINMLTHLLIMVERIRLAVGRGEAPDALVKARPLQPVMHDPQLAAAAGDLVGRLEEALHLSVPEWETNHVNAFLQGADLKPEGIVDLGPEPVEDEGLRFTTELIARVSDLVGVDLREDKKLLEKLALHVRPMLFRTAHGVQIRNPVLQDIQRQFPDLLILVIACLAGLEEDLGLNLASESEAGYLVLYFQQAIDRARRRLRVVIVCSTGRGTALFLRSRVERRFPDWHIVDVLGVRDLDKIVARISSASDIDLVVSTVPLEGLPLPAVVVSSLLTDMDADLLAAGAGRAGLRSS